MSWVWEQFLVVGVHQVLREVFLRRELPPAYMALSGLAVASLLIYLAHPSPFSLDMIGVPKERVDHASRAPTLVRRRSWVVNVKNSASLGTREGEERCRRQVEQAPGRSPGWDA